MPNGETETKDLVSQLPRSFPKKRCDVHQRQLPRDRKSIRVSLSSRGLRGAAASLKRQCRASETSNKEWRRKREKGGEGLAIRWLVRANEKQARQEMADTLHLSNHFLLFYPHKPIREPRNKSNNNKRKRNKNLFPSVSPFLDAKLGWPPRNHRCYQTFIIVQTDMHSRLI